jgi:hypothetical protein
VILYHGTNQIIGKIDLSKGRMRTDFGLGFYLSGKIGTAQDWAISKTLLLGGIPTVLQYELSEGYKELYGHRFSETPSDEWLDFVVFNRKLNFQGNNGNNGKKEPRHEYNWVSGPIADDNMNTVVKEYIAGNISKDEAIHRARILPQTFQICLHTTEAIGFIDEGNVPYRQLKNGKWSKNWINR